MYVCVRERERERERDLVIYQTVIQMSDKNILNFSHLNKYIINVKQNVIFDFSYEIYL